MVEGSSRTTFSDGLRKKIAKTRESLISAEGESPKNENSTKRVPLNKLALQHLGTRQEESFLFHRTV